MKNKNFQNRVYEIVKKIPRGEVLTYKRVAEKAGFPRAWRAVGNILNKNKNLPLAEPCFRQGKKIYSENKNPKIPCHRVIRSDGKLGGYNEGANKKSLLLKQENFEI